MNPEPVKFLIVDDTEDNLLALGALLEREGLTILKARSGAEALELLLVHEVALALLDVQMPDMNGLELAELMRGAERTKHVPIIFITAGARDPRRVFKGYESGAVDFLYKPVDPHMLRSKADVFFELYRQRKELADLLRLNELFVGILGHDLRNPLTTMITGAQVLQRHVTDATQLRGLNRMAAAGERMKNMIDQLLDLTRARLADGLGFSRARNRFDVGALLKRAADELHGAHPERELKVDLRGDCVTWGDADRLLQLFSNIIANALQHGAAGAPISIEADGSSAEVVTRIHNAGQISPELMPELFDPFRLRRSGRSTSSEGLGLGLFIAQQIAAAHGGTVTAESHQERGTTFTVRIPRNTPAPPLAQRVGGTREVLIVDDDDELRESLRDAFEHEGYAASAANDGQQALAMLNGSGHRPDVVILDMMLPVVDGQKVYQAMQTDPELSKIPVIVSTSSPQQAPHGTIVMTKPLQLERLLDTVASLWR